MLINLRNALMAGKRLPYDTEVEYLESTGTQYIDTGIVSSGFGIRADVVCAQTQSGGEMAIVGRSRGDGFELYSNYAAGKFGLWNRSGNYIELTRQLVLSRVYSISAEITTTPTMTLSIDGNVTTKSITSATIADGNILVFKHTSYYFKGCIYSCKIYVNGTLVRDYIPVRVGSGASAVGYLYDRVSKRLFGNAGSGAFVLGPDKAVPILSLHRYASPSNGVAIGKMGCTDLFHRITAKDYVQSGLVAMWDGIENAGWGVHDASATTWKDIVGENDATLQSALSESRYWGNNYFYNALESAMFIGTPTSALKNTFTTGDFTIQGIFIPEIQPTSGNFCVFQCSPSGTTTDGCIFSVTNSLSCGSANMMTWASTRAVINFPSNIRSWDQILGTVFNPTFIFDSVNGTQEMKLWEMSGTITTTAAIPTASDLTSFAIGCYNWSAGRNRNVRGKLYNLRIYSRKLTADEIARNYRVDKARFNLP